MVGYRILSSSLSSLNTGKNHGPGLRWGNLDFTLFNINVYQLLLHRASRAFVERSLTAWTSSPRSPSLRRAVSLTSRTSGPSATPPTSSWSLSAWTWTVDTKEFGYQGGLYRRLRTREDLKYNKDPVCRCKDDEETISDRASGARGRLWQHAGQ